MRAFACAEDSLSLSLNFTQWIAARITFGNRDEWMKRRKKNISYILRVVGFSSFHSMQRTSFTIYKWLSNVLYTSCILLYE